MRRSSSWLTRSPMLGERPMAAQFAGLHDEVRPHAAVGPDAARRDLQSLRLVARQRGLRLAARQFRRQPAASISAWALPLVPLVRRGYIGRRRARKSRDRRSSVAPDPCPPSASTAARSFQLRLHPKCRQLAHRMRQQRCRRRWHEFSGAAS
jgi:hypothetical protein